MLDRILYAEVYLICLMVAAMLLYWTDRRGNRSTSERWMIALLLAFCANFTANFLFTLAGIFLKGQPALVPALYAFKTLYFITMALGVGGWCGFGETELRSENSRRKAGRWMILLPAAAPIAVTLVNLFTHQLFSISEDGGYHRHFLFHFVMLYLILMSGQVSVRLLIAARKQMDPVKKGHLRLTAGFPVCIMVAWLLCFIGESIPVICVSVMLALLGMFIGANSMEVSMDKLTQVNNRQNLISFLNYRIANHEDKLYLLMIDVDFFKTINDTYGHLEGDRALEFVASTLKKSCMNYKKRPYIARYGGDEFMIVLEGNRQEVADLVATIRSLLKENKPRDMEYEITLSIGVTEYESGMTAKGLIASADERMYAIKQARG